MENYKYVHHKMLKVDDNWSPNFPNNEVDICTGIGWRGTYGEVIQNVHGMDDSAAERRCRYETDDELIKQWEEWKNFAENINEVVNKQWFLDRGFLDE